MTDDPVTRASLVQLSALCQRVFGIVFSQRECCLCRAASGEISLQLKPYWCSAPETESHVYSQSTNTPSPRQPAPEPDGPFCTPPPEKVVPPLPPTLSVCVCVSLLPKRGQGDGVQVVSVPGWVFCVCMCVSPPQERAGSGGSGGFCSRVGLQEWLPEGFSSSWSNERKSREEERAVARW